MRRVSVVPFAIWGFLITALQAADWIWAYGIIQDVQSGISPDEGAAVTVGNWINAASFILWAFSAFAFLQCVLRAKQFLADRGGVQLPDFGGTVVYFAIPFANFYVPWKRLATIRKSLRHYVATGEFALVESGSAGIVPIAGLYIAAALFGRFVGSMPSSTMEQLASLLSASGVSSFLWTASFVVSLFWLSSLVKDLRLAFEKFEAEPMRAVNVEAQPEHSQNERQEIFEQPTISAEEAKPREEVIVTSDDVTVSGRVHEGLRRLTWLVGLVWIVITLIAVVSRINDGSSEYNPAPIADTLTIVGVSSFSFCCAYFFVRVLAWVGKGFFKPRTGSTRSNEDIAAVCAGVIGLLVGGFGLAHKATETEAYRSQLDVIETADVVAPIPPSVVLPPVITQAEFQAVNLGMTYPEVVAIVGAEGREYDAHTIADWKYVSYHWVNDGGFGSATMTFRNGRLEEKRPSNLP